MVRGKFKVVKIASVDWSATAKEVTLQPQYDQTIEEDRRYCKATPSGSITMMVDNPSAVEYLALGKFFYVDFIKIEEAKPKPAEGSGDATDGSGGGGGHNP